MEEPNLLVICLNAFAAVLILLTILSGALRGLIELFPERGDPNKEAQKFTTTAPQPGTDAAIAVAIATAANAIIPGARVTRIEEIK
ncbi:MAG: hypothetical protein IAF00_02515 [Phycisphaerales bacterium]|nr:hypothetical protein [Phycisphaerales bacterium]